MITEVSSSDNKIETPSNKDLSLEVLWSTYTSVAVRPIVTTAEYSRGKILVVNFWLLKRGIVMS